MKASFPIEQKFSELGLQYLITGNFESEIERNIFMAINLARAVPAMFSVVVKQVK
jgi:hypothetical protein